MARSSRLLRLAKMYSALAEAAESKLRDSAARVVALSTKRKELGRLADQSHGSSMYMASFAIRRLAQTDAERVEASRSLAELRRHFLALRQRERMFQARAALEMAQLDRKQVEQDSLESALLMLGPDCGKEDAVQLKRPDE